MSILKRLETMKGKLEELNQERSKLIGKREQLMDGLKARGINSYEEGVAEETRLIEEFTAAEAAADALVNDLMEKYKGFV